MQTGERIKVTMRGRLPGIVYTWTGVVLGTARSDLQHLGGRSWIIIDEELNNMHRIPISDQIYTFEVLSVYTTEELLTHKCQHVRDFMSLERVYPYYTKGLYEQYD